MAPSAALRDLPTRGVAVARAARHAYLKLEPCARRETVRSIDRGEIRYDQRSDRGSRPDHDRG
jgi:hypothetical protein